MPLHPDAPLLPASLSTVADAYGLGEPLASEFVARGAMGAIHRITTRMRGRECHWAVKRAYWNQFTEVSVRREVEFATRCRMAGVPAPRSVPRVDDDRFVLTVDRADDESQYRVLSWVEGRTGDRNDERTIAPLMDWMARIHRLAASTRNQRIDDWFVSVTHDWSGLSQRLATAAPDLAATMRARLADLRALTNFVNGNRDRTAVWCHTDIGADNLIWSGTGPVLIDWENAGPLVPRQELGAFLRSLGSTARASKAYRAYRRAGGPTEISEAANFATSIAVHLNYLGGQSELLLDDAHPEQHEFARSQAANAAQGLPSISQLTELVDVLTSEDRRSA